MLCIVAHPDDEIAFAGTLYKTSTHLDGVADLAVITNGEGGFKYSTLGENLYGLELTDAAVGRAHLPRIRQAELVAGCRWLGVHRIHFLGERDHRYTQDPDEVLADDAGVWDLERVRARLDLLLAAGDYDFVLTRGAKAGQKQEVFVRLKPLPIGTTPYRPAPPPPRRWYDKWYVWAGVAGGVAAVALTVSISVTIATKDEIGGFGADHQFKTSGLRF